MTPVKFYIQLAGVMVELNGHWEHKHHPSSAVDAVGQQLALQLGGSFLFWEEA